MSGPPHPPTAPPAPAVAAPSRALPELWELRERALAHNNAGRHAPAEHDYAELLARLADMTPTETQVAEHRELAVRARIGLAFVDVTAGKLRHGLALLDEASTIAGPDQPHLHALIARQRAVLLANVGRLRDALAEMQALRPVQHLLTEQDLIIVLLNRALLHAHLGNHSAAAADNEQLLALATLERYPTEHFMATYNSGTLAYLSGDLPRALATMARADAMEVTVTRGPGRLDQGKVLLEAGLVEEAIEVLAAAVPESLAAGQNLIVAQIETTLSQALRLAGRHQEAYAAALAAEEHLGRQAAGPQGDPARLAGLAARFALGEEPALIRHAAAAIARRALRTRSDLELPAHLLVAEATLAAEPAAAETLLHRPRVPAAASLSDRLRWRRIRAASALARGEQTRARRELRRAADELTREQSRIVSLDLGTARALHTEPLIDLDLEQAVASGPGAVYSATERWRAATANLAAVRPPDDPRTAELVARLRGARAQLAGAGSASAAGSIRAEIAAIEREIRLRDWSLHAEGTSAGVPVLPFREARERLDSDGADLCSFLRVDDAIAVLVVSSGGARVVPCLPADRAVELVRRVHADLRAALTQPRSPLAGAVRDSLAAELAELDAALLAEVRRSDLRLVVVPTRPISGLPWALLPSLAGRPVTVARSVTSYLRTRGDDPARSADPAIPAMALVAGPGLGAAADVERAAVRAAWRRRGVAPDRLSTRAEVLTAVARCDLVHIAAHGHHEPRSPLFSHLELADGPLFAHELQARGVSARHVVLAACEVGRATPRPGEEALGFAATLLALGAACVVAAHTAVPDDLAAAVMTRYHRRLADGAPTDEALAEAITSTDELAGVFAAFGSRLAF
ncbi:MAG: CHAT domain-containing protein [Tetrasphaera sp.]